MPIHRVPSADYQQLIDKLQLETPKSLTMIWTMENVNKGKLSANFYVDKWPEFSAVVGELIWPRRSDVADIVCYATSSEAILTILEEGNLVTWGKRQEFQRIEDRHADFLMKNFTCHGEPALECINERELHYYPSTTQVPREVLQSTLSAPPPDGYMFGKLQEHHTPMVTSQWPRLHDWPNKEPYFRDLITNYSTTALYHVNDLETPIVYTVQFPCGQSFAFAVESVRGTKLIRTVFQRQSARLMIDGVSPRVEEASVGVKTSLRNNGIRLFNVKDLILKQTRTTERSKL